MTTELEFAGAAAQEVLGAVTGTSPGREGLEWAADIIRGRRARTQIKVLQRTAEALREAGLDGHVVPDKTLVPLLEFAGLEAEDDDDMIERWAGLLANAASGSSDVPPSFPEILRQLEPPEAQALDHLVDQDGRPISKWTWALEDDLSRAQIDNLERLGLIRVARDPTAFTLASELVASTSDHPSATVTHLGVALVTACRRPLRPGST